ncbi:SUKH-4 family immunity protein [Paenibacillus sp. GCM10028914]|uniref:SUKH-4 family immunity protein n=1 Tax=Paenibacillus sp. GCM10028914 TaxID=3273416 RepID=UPI003615F7E0
MRERNIPAIFIPQEFLDSWDRETFGLVEYDDKVIDSYSLSQESKYFLIKAGLPESASPFLTFESSLNGGGVKLTEKYDDANPLYSKYIYVGFTGNGHPICIDELNDEVIYIDYDNENEEVFINSSITQFTESLLVYVDFIEKIKAENGRRAFLERKATNASIEWVANRLEEIDADSLTQGAFWKEELNNFHC